ncbi:hypothetical protein [Mycobacterium mantenii]|uniref:hypothetical protein n=1 Tax=Mycobacterium mantenii TaxID=560555 RepID=UPI001E50ECB6|nr:hypothetical protein [Mycobacterium mantenii]
MRQTMRVDGAGIQAMAARWGALVDGLNHTAVPTGLGLACQLSAAAVNGAHIDVTAFTAGMAAQVGARATSVGQADTRYTANEVESTTDLATMTQSVTSV